VKLNTFQQSVVFGREFQALSGFGVSLVYEKQMNVYYTRLMKLSIRLEKSKPCFIVPALLRFLQHAFKNIESYGED